MVASKLYFGHGPCFSGHATYILELFAVADLLKSLGELFVICIKLFQLLSFCVLVVVVPVCIWITFSVV